ncbi:hypothetical protein [Vibrio zhanjiangensis]
MKYFIRFNKLKHPQDPIPLELCTSRVNKITLRLT